MINILRLDDLEFTEEGSSGLPHVLLVLDQFPETLGGGERIVLRLADLLPQYGYRVSILTFAIHPKTSALMQFTCPVYLLALKRTYDINAFVASFAFQQFLKINQVKIVQTFFESSDLWAGFITKIASTAKLIWSRRDMGILRLRKHRVGYRLMAALPDAVFAVSEDVRRFCIEVDRVNPEHVLTIYNGIDISSWSSISRLTRTADQLHITTVGNIRRVKGHDVFIKAAAHVLKRYPNVQFSIAGDVLEHDYFAQLCELVIELGLGGRVHFVGGVTDLQSHLLATDIFVLPSRSEGFSNAIIEAMAAALPVVATNVGGNAEAVIDGINGFVVAPEDPEALATAISRLLGDPVQAKAMGISGRTLVEEKFTIESMMSKIAGTYHKLLS